MKVADKALDDAILSRFVFLPFEVSLGRNNWVFDLDKKLFESERDAIFTFLVKYMVKLRESNFCFVKSARSKAMEREFRSSDDSFKHFIARFCVVRHKGYVSKTDLYKAYIDFCNKFEYAAINNDVFNDRVLSMRDISGNKKKRRRNPYTNKAFGNPVTSYVGIELKKSVV